MTSFKSSSRVHAFFFYFDSFVMCHIAIFWENRVQKLCLSHGCCIFLIDCSSPSRWCCTRPKRRRTETKKVDSRHDLAELSRTEQSATIYTAARTGNHHLSLL